MWRTPALIDAVVAVENGRVGFGYIVVSGVRASGNTPTSRTVVAPRYPGVAGAPAVQTRP